MATLCFYTNEYLYIFVMQMHFFKFLFGRIFKFFKEQLIKYSCLHL